MGLGAAAGAASGGAAGSVAPGVGNVLGFFSGGQIGAASGAAGGIAAGGMVGAGVGFITCASSTGNGGGVNGRVGSDGGDLKKLSPSEIKKLKAAGEDAERIKKEIIGAGGSKYDLFKTSAGDIVVKLKSGAGKAQPTGLNIKKF